MNKLAVNKLFKLVRELTGKITLRLGKCENYLSIIAAIRKSTGKSFQRNFKDDGQGAIYKSSVYR